MSDTVALKSLLEHVFRFGDKMHTRWIFKPVVLYSVLNLFVTLTNKLILGHGGPVSSSMPFVLTGVHAIASSIGTVIIGTRHRHHDNRLVAAQDVTRKQHLMLVMFSLFYTINIVLSSLSIAIVSLAVHQTIRAAAPVVSVLVSILTLGRSWKFYGPSTYLSLVPISIGVILATKCEPGRSNAAQGSVYFSSLPSHTTFGIFLTFAGTVTAVLKTVLTHKLLRSASLNLSPLGLFSILSPYAAIQAFAFAYYKTDTKGIAFSAIRTGIAQTLCFAPSFTVSVPTCSKWKPSIQDIKVVGLWTSNAIAAFGLNVASFQASKTSGPVSMAIAANLKQIAIVSLPHLAETVGINTWLTGRMTRQILVGTGLTVAGSIWYTLTAANDQGMVNLEHTEKQGKQRLNEKAPRTRSY